jgi:hypothetical protein
MSAIKTVASASTRPDPLGRAALVALAPAREALAVSAIRGDVNDAIAPFDVAAYLRPDVPGFRSGLARAILDGAFRSA